MDTQNNKQMTGGVAPDAAVDMVFVAGDRGAGLVIVGLGDTERTFTHGGQNIHARLETVARQPGLWDQTLRLDPEQPIRFRVEWLIPDTAQNAAMTLNGGLLIGPFAPDWPANGPQLPTPACGNQEPVSTLHAGHFQAIDFTWKPGDALTLYLVLKPE